MSNKEVMELEFSLELKASDAKFYRYCSIEDGIRTFSPDEAPEWINGLEYVDFDEEEQDNWSLHEAGYIFEKGYVTTSSHTACRGGLIEGEEGIFDEEENETA